MLDPRVVAAVIRTEFDIRMQAFAKDPKPANFINAYDAMHAYKWLADVRTPEEIKKMLTDIPVDDWISHIASKRVKEEIN